MITEKDILEYLKENDGFNLIQVQNNLDKVLNAHGDVINSLFESKIKLEYWEVYIETLVIKLILASKSILSISKGASIISIYSKKKVEIIDAPSINILTRSIIESYLTLEYLYFNDLDKDEKLFRFKLFEISGFQSRQLFSFPTEKAFIEKKEREKERIETLREEITNSPYYRQLEKNQIWKLDTFGLPRLSSWNNLLAASKLSKRLFKDVYSLYSNYAHSEYIALIQINETSLNINDQKNIDNVEMNLRLVRILNAITIKSLIKQFKCAEIVYNGLPKNIISTIELWSKIGLSN